MADRLYDRDALAWSEQQADLLRRLAAGERVGEALDWPNLIEEIEDLGRSELHTVESLLTRALEHLLKVHLDPAHPAVPHWSGEIAAFLASAHRRCGATMRQRIDLPALYGDACYAASAGIPKSLQAQAPAIPPVRPYTLDGLLTARADPTGLAQLLTA